MSLRKDFLLNVCLKTQRIMPKKTSVPRARRILADCGYPFSPRKPHKPRHNRKTGTIFTIVNRTNSRNQRLRRPLREDSRRELMISRRPWGNFAFLSFWRILSGGYQKFYEVPRKSTDFHVYFIFRKIPQYFMPTRK